MEIQQNYIIFLQDTLNLFTSTYPIYPRKFKNILSHILHEEGLEIYKDVFGKAEPEEHEVEKIPEKLISKLNETEDESEISKVVKLAEIFIIDHLILGVRNNKITAEDAKFYISKIPFTTLAYMTYLR